MNHKSRVAGLSFTILFTILFLLSFTVTGNAQTLYSCESPVGGSNPFLHTIDPNTGTTLTTQDITLPGETVRGCNGMARHPETGVCYIMVNINPEEGETVPPRVSATINQDTGVATAIGNPEETFSSIAFTSDGTLYGVTGDGASTPETLFTINIVNGSTTFVQTLGNGNDGEAIAFNPLDGLIYHASGNGPINIAEIFESINPNTNTVTPIPYSGDTNMLVESSSLVHQSGNVLLSGDIGSRLLSITTTGVIDFIGDMDHVAKGLAFDCGVTPTMPVTATDIPTISEWGLITMACLLGILGFITIRRRKVSV